MRERLAGHDRQCPCFRHCGHVLAHGVDHLLSLDGHVRDINGHHIVAQAMDDELAFELRYVVCDFDRLIIPSKVTLTKL